MPPERRARGLALAALLVVLLASPATLAQSTGGSMGGGDWGGGGGGSGGGSYSSGSSSSPAPTPRPAPVRPASSGSTSSSSSSSGPSGSDYGWMLLFLGVLVGAPLAFLYLATRARKPRLDVSVLRLAVDARARRALQAELQRIAGMARTGDAGGLLSMLRQVSIKLRACREAWTYAGVVDTRPMKPDQAQAFFQAQVQQARAIFQHELVRAADGAVSTAAAPADLRARPEEGAGLVVITIAVAARVKVADFGDLPESEDVRRWLEAVRQIRSHDLVAVEVIWTPAAEEDRMSSVELETLYPEMKKLRDATSTAGRSFCDHCGGLFPAELQACPHCGAKVPDAA